MILNIETVRLKLRAGRVPQIRSSPASICICSGHGHLDLLLLHLVVENSVACSCRTIEVLVGLVDHGLRDAPRRLIRRGLLARRIAWILLVVVDGRVDAALLGCSHVARVATIVFG